MTHDGNPTNTIPPIGIYSPPINLMFGYEMYFLAISNA